MSDVYVGFVLGLCIGQNWAIFKGSFGGFKEKDCWGNKYSVVCRTFVQLI